MVAEAAALVALRAGRALAMSHTSKMSVDTALELLDLNYQSTKEQFERARKRKLLELHPDRNHGDPEATAKTQRIVEASEVLTEHYNRLGQARSAGGAFASGAASSSASGMWRMPPPSMPGASWIEEQMIEMENAKQRSMHTIRRQAEQNLEAIKRLKADRWADNPLGSMLQTDPHWQHYDNQRIRIEQWRDDLFADGERKYAEAAQLLRSFHSLMREGQACAKKGAEEVGSFKGGHLGDADKCFSSAVKVAETLRRSGTIWYPACHVWVYIWRSQVAFEMGQYFKAKSEAKTALTMIRKESLENDIHTLVSALEHSARGHRALNEIGDAIKAFDLSLIHI